MSWCTWLSGSRTSHVDVEGAGERGKTYKTNNSNTQIRMHVRRVKQVVLVK